MALAPSATSRDKQTHPRLVHHQGKMMLRAAHTLSHAGQSHPRGEWPVSAPGAQ